MKIAALKAYRIRVPLKRKITHASFSRSESESILVCCELDDGTIGWGEAVPRAYVTGETPDSVLAQYQATDFREMTDWRWNLTQEVVPLCQHITLSEATDVPAEYQARCCFGNAARCALELSLLDAATRAQGESLSAIFPYLDEDRSLIQSLPSVRYSAVLTSMKPLKQTVLSLLYRLTGFRQCKVKVGMPGIDDRALLRKVRKLTGSRMGLRIDANEAWNRTELETRDADFQPLQIQSIEQPVAHTSIDELKHIRGQLSALVMLDESLCSQEDAERAISEGYCDAFNLRISKLGGLIPTFQIARMAHQAGIRCQLGCQVGETGILSAAGRHFACSIQELDFLEGSFDRFLLKQNIINEKISFQWGGVAPALQGPGLGVTVNPTRLAQFVDQEMQLI
ncbi:enolase C-terminal domain-like protein [Gimesia panareensis]|uniref:L-Ala-D/L-Glu epimerase n=1 Tax=Gimesia panareensis TaxID=2527978 RepID=A0A517Q4B1_9PLAN|nr:enolase C-terminal domain-like protein [Gimesia panareensis]QDT26483.1 L-Ala-D/L-Glu epimerase [Gimesia panareensis]QDU50640.1 L-Ala-D/L-Glu epimerase [Gimesia panareensis]